MIWPYCVSNGYVISSDLLAPLVLASRHYNTIYYNEEMNVGLSNMILNVTPYRYHEYQNSLLRVAVCPSSSLSCSSRLLFFSLIFSSANIRKQCLIYNQ